MRAGGEADSPASTAGTVRRGDEDSQLVPAAGLADIVTDPRRRLGANPIVGDVESSPALAGSFPSWTSDIGKASRCAGSMRGERPGSNTGESDEETAVDADAAAAAAMPLLYDEMDGFSLASTSGGRSIQGSSTSAGGAAAGAVAPSPDTLGGNAEASGGVLPAPVDTAFPCSSSVVWSDAGELAWMSSMSELRRSCECRRGKLVRISAKPVLALLREPAEGPELPEATAVGPDDGDPLR